MCFSRFELRFPFPIGDRNLGQGKSATKTTAARRVDFTHVHMYIVTHKFTILLALGHGTPAERNLTRNVVTLSDDIFHFR